MTIFTFAHFDQVPNNPSALWYYVSSVSEPSLGGIVKDMFCRIGNTGIANHNLCATGASMLFEANVQEKVIQEELTISV